jgi:hypothetical protein
MKQQIMRVRHPKTNEWVTINKGKDYPYSSKRQNTKQLIKNERRASVQMSQRWLER